MKTFLTLLLSLPALLSANVVINEVQSSNDETCLDEYGVSSDWIELYNTGSSAVDLSGWGITDKAEKPFKWSFPAGTTLAPNGHLRLFASGRETVQAEPETAIAEPTDFAPNLVLWLRGDDFSGRNQGSRITRWTDRSGCGNTATQIFSRAPTVSLNAINGHTALAFNRSSKQHLLLPKPFNGMSSLSNVTIMVACKWGGTANAGLFGQWASGSSTQNAHFEIQSGATLRWRVADSDLKASSAVTADTWMTLGAITDCDRETPTLALIKDGLLLQSQAKAIGKQSFAAADLIYIGDSCSASSDSGGRFWDGLIAEVVIINRALTEEEWTRLSNYFAGKYGTNTARANHHLPFKLGSEGETLTLSQPDGTVADTLTFGAIPCDASYGRSPSGGTDFAWFASPTPEAANTATAYTAPLEPVRFSVERGLYDQPFSLTLSHPDPDAAIVYTLDYSEPSPSNGLHYAGETLSIAHTTVVRAWASKPGALPYRSIQTHSYLFLADVPTQTDVPEGCPTVWNSGGQTAATYGISTQVVATPQDVIALTNALRQLPVLSLAIPAENVFGADHGVYSHATDDTLEEATSAEWITNGVGFVQADAGLKAQGAASREFGKTPKKPLRLCFRGRYGLNRLKTPVLQDVGYHCEDFNTLVLRAEYNNAWTHSDSSQRLRGSHVRDQWMRDTQQAMSGYQSHGDHVHLFINGRYWGIYNVAERIDASLGANLFGGEKEEYDALAYSTGGIKARDGDTASWNRLLSASSATLTEQANYEEVARQLNLEAFADYMLLNFFGGNQDWPGNNFAMFCSRLEGGQFYFCCWDAERTLENVTDNRLSATFSTGPKKLHDNLKTSNEYRLLFADRVHKHLFNGGALTPEATVPRYRALSDRVEPAVFAEAARWGSYRLENGGTASKRYGVSDWVTERDRVLNTYLQQRPARFLSQLQSDGLYPSLAAPEFTETIDGVESRITLSIPSGAQVYYTVDGSDPRTAFTGEVAPSATLYTQIFTVTATTRIKARALLNTTWSALSEYTALANRERAVFIQPDEGNWDKDANWSTGTFPDGAGMWAVIPAPTAVDEDGKRNVRVNKQPVTIGHIDLTNGSATNRICNKKDAVAGSTLTFDGGELPATLSVTNRESGMATVDLTYGVVLASDLRLIIGNTAGHPEYGALRLQQAWSGEGGLIKEGPGLCSLTGEGKAYTGETLIREGVLTFTAKSIPTATRSISVEPGGQLRLVGGNAVYAFPCPITISGQGRDPSLGDGANRQGALRYTPTSVKNSMIQVETPVIITNGAAIHVSNTSNTLFLARGLRGSGGMVKTGAGTLTLAAPVELEKCATTVDAGCLTFADRAEVATLSGSGDVAVLAGRVSVHTLGGSLHLLARLNRSGEENLADNGLIHLAASETALPVALTLYLGADDDPAARYYGALCVPLDLPLAARLDTIPTTVYVQDATGTHHFDGETWRAVTATVSARPVTFSIDGLPLQGRMLSVTRGPDPEQPFSYAQWCRSVFPPEAFDDAATVAPATERDGIPNLFRYAFGMSLEDTAADFYPHLDLIGEGRRYRWKMIPSRDDLRYRIEAVSDVRDWSDPECLFDSDQQLPGPPDPLGWRFLIDEQTLPKRFYRLRVFLKEQPSE